MIAVNIEESWTYVGKKKNKIGRIYAYHRESGEIVESNQRFAVWRKGDKKTAQKLRNRIKRVGIS
jgi:IS1 family transposase